jgi:hypothetical protein
LSIDKHPRFAIAGEAFRQRVYRRESHGSRAQHSVVETGHCSVNYATNLHLLIETGKSRGEITPKLTRIITKSATILAQMQDFSIFNWISVKKLLLLAE